MLVSERLRRAIISSKMTHYRIGKEAGVDTKVIDTGMKHNLSTVGRND